MKIEMLQHDGNEDYTDIAIYINGDFAGEVTVEKVKIGEFEEIFSCAVINGGLESFGGIA